jgi:Yip1-like protein
LGFKGYFLSGVRIMGLNGEEAVRVSRDKNAFLPAMLVFLIGGLSISVGIFIEDGIPSLSGTGKFIAVMAFTNLAFSFFIAAVMHLMAKLAGGRAAYGEYYRAMALGSITSWAQAVPFFGTFVALWGLPVNVVVLEKTHGIARIKSIAIVAVAVAMIAVFLYTFDFSR